MKFAAIHHAKESSIDQLIFDVSMQVLVLRVLTLHGALRRVHPLPIHDAVGTESSLAGRALLWAQKNFETD